jgi:hypothetical protein
MRRLERRRRLGSRRFVMGRAIRLLAVIGGLVVASPAIAGDITGKWKAEFDTQVGVQKYTYDLHADGKALTGTAHFERMGQTGDADLTEGTVDGDTISFVEMLDFQGTPVKITYEGKVAGDEIAFTRKVGELATETFTATRVVD